MIDLMVQPKFWNPETSGERLLLMLVRNSVELRVLAETLNGLGPAAQHSALRLGRRFADLSSFFVGASVLHLQQRMIRLSQDAREKHPYDRDAALKVTRERVCDVLSFTPLDYEGDFGVLVEEVLTSAEQLGKEPSAPLKQRVARAGPPHCYSCGRMFGTIHADAPGPDGLKPTADHVWPIALGGDTIEANLLPACAPCNSRKGHIATWQMAWLQPVVFSDTDQTTALPGLPVPIKMALHMRAAMNYATANGASLRDAFLAIGPRDTPARIDQDQGYDFFNLRVHDELRTNVLWRPR
ncbi:HNH endonuclease [Pararoseomonas indoligenes]|uniref:HNH endonuclease n=1 Tax=Roseomonas indoligenes TaxID=2820811 RepID=A0A940S8U5_9PROT|nr:HNH endonuclease [Pararoseomonas indoligenes]MBP0496270.1 HNH endonuclease [Pararoseomonas indoligenes]